jgi:hypothetical protein
MQHFPERRVIRREADPQQLPSTAVNDLHRYWRSKHVDGQLPPRAVIDPLDIRHLLPNILLGSIEYDPLRIFYRLAGTRIVEFRGEMTGHYLDSFPWLEAATRAAIQNAYELMVETRSPTFTETEIRSINGTPHRIYTGLWPLATTPDGPIDMFIAIEDYGSLKLHDLEL